MATNMLGHQASSPASNTLNSASAITLNIGSSLSVPGCSATITITTPTSSYSAPNVLPTLSNGVMSFNGAQSIIYADNTALHVTAQYSVQFDFMASTVAPAYQYIMTSGEGYGIGWPEFSCVLEGNEFLVITNSNNAASGEAYYEYSTNIKTNTWYRVGFMFYNTGSQNYIRCYLNGSNIFQRAIAAYGSNGTAHNSNLTGLAITAAADAMPYTSSNGLALGNDCNNYTGRFFTGSIRNFFIGKHLFWAV